MNILFLCHRIPYPLDKGEKIRAFNLLSHLAKDHTVHLGAFVDDPADVRHVPTVRDMVGGRCLIVPLRRPVALARMASALIGGAPLTTSHFWSARLNRWVTEKLRTASIDRVVVFSTAMAPYMMEARSFPGAHVLFDMVDVDSDKWRQYAEASAGPKAWLYRREARLLLRLERQAAAAFGATVLVSQFEADTFAGLAPEARDRVHAVPNGVDLDDFSPHGEYQNPFSAREIPIVMTGRMDYRPNIDGARWFAQQVMPAIRAVLPAARFHIVGARPPAALRSLDATSVSGAVKDVRPYIAHAAAVVAPLRLARGVQNKVLEAMAMQKPVVATSPATRALAVRRGLELWIEDEPEQFAQAVIAAATGTERLDVAARARRHVEAHCSWAGQLARLDELLANPVSPRAKSAEARARPVPPDYAPGEADSASEFT